jgi:hypothetical protein
MSAELDFSLACAGAVLLYGVGSASWVLSKSTDDARMQEIAHAIQESAKAYLDRQYLTIDFVGRPLLIPIGFIIGALFSGSKEDANHMTLRSRVGRVALNTPRECIRVSSMGYTCPHPLDRAGQGQGARHDDSIVCLLRTITVLVFVRSSASPRPQRAAALPQSVYPDGTPPLHGRAEYRRWIRVCSRAYFVRSLPKP